MAEKKAAESRRAGIGIGLLVAGALRWILDLAGFFGDIDTVRDLTAGAMTIPADFALLILQYLAVIAGCVFVTPAIATLGLKRLERHRSVQRWRAHARKLLPHLSDAQLTQLGLLINGANAIPKPEPTLAVTYGLIREIQYLDPQRNLYELKDESIGKEILAELDKRRRRT